MTILLCDAGKRFNRDWIFRHFHYTFQSGNSYAITGPNGSGKSTLLQVIAGAVALSEGKIECKMTVDRLQLTEGKQTAGSNHQQLENEELYRRISIAAPYLETIEEMTVMEFLHFHQTFKPLLPGISIKEIISTVGLNAAAHKQIRYYSSGMKQRVKLAQAIFSDVPVVLLDEPCTNLDTMGITLYQSLVRDHCKDRLVIVSSNDEAEYGFCNGRINISDYK